MAAGSVSTVSGCGCCQADGLIFTACPEHRYQWDTFEARVRQLLDHELDERIRELAGRAPRRIERKVGAVGGFAVRR